MAPSAAVINTSPASLPAAPLVSGVPVRVTPLPAPVTAIVRLPPAPAPVVSMTLPPSLNVPPAETSISPPAVRRPPAPTFRASASVTVRPPPDVFVMLAFSVFTSRSRLSPAPEANTTVSAVHSLVLRSVTGPAYKTSSPSVAASIRIVPPPTLIAASGSVMLPPLDT